MMESSAILKNSSKAANKGLEEILDRISDLETPAIEQFLHQVGILVARRKASHLSEQESSLLQAINHCIPLDMQRRFEALSTKMQSGSISSAEHDELLSLIDPLEQKYAERLEKMIELARLRGISLETLQQQLHLSPFKKHA